MSVTTGATSTVTGAFAARGFLEVATSPAVGGRISIDGAPADAWGLFTDLPTGTHHHLIEPVVSAAIAA